jgi:LmbE family N-acetylglucosaminyl deacetylase
MRVLAVGAHPDDLEILCAGTLARYARRGDQVFMAVSTDGAGGSMDRPEAEIRQVRQAEARASAELIGAEAIWMGQTEAQLFDTAETRLRYIDLVRRTRPDVILTHDPVNDYHPDHLATGQILWSVRVMVVQPNIVTEHPPAAVIPDIYYMDTIAGINFSPQMYVDVSDTMEVKRRMLAAHASQIELMKARYDMTLLEFMEICTAFRGVQTGTRYAEAFRRAATFPANPRHLLP